MGFPNSVAAFATKNPGDKVQASHVNDLQSEVTAIENGLINGPITLPASSIAGTLSVSGNSTFGGNLQVNGTSTFVTRPVMGPPDHAKVYLQSSAAVASSVQSTLTFLSQDILTNSSMHSTAANADRITPQSTGLYMISAQVESAGTPGAASAVNLRLVDSSGAILGIASANHSAGVLDLQAVGFKRFDALGGYVQCRWVNASGSTYSLSSGASQTWFALTKL